MSMRTTRDASTITMIHAQPATPRLGAVGTAVPQTSYTQTEILDVFGIDDPRIRGIFLNGGIGRRNLILPPRTQDGGRHLETQGELLRKHTRGALEIGAGAVADCLERAGATKGDIAYLCCVSSTGFLTPGLSALLIKELGLRRDCARLDVVGMGCNAGLNALNATSSWAATNPGRLAVLLCVEVCSAAYVHDGSMRTAVVNSLFGDGAAAVGVMASGHTDGPTVLGFASHIIPDAVDAMRYDWDDDAGRFSFYLDPEVPYVVGAHAERAIASLLRNTALHPTDIDHWIVHSGGRKVIDSVRVNLGLTRHDMRHSTGVLRDHGNVSSSSFLFSLQRLQEEELARPGDTGVLMTMGPGSTIELALLRW